MALGILKIIAILYILYIVMVAFIVTFRKGILYKNKYIFILLQGSIVLLGWISFVSLPENFIIDRIISLLIICISILSFKLKENKFGITRMLIILNLFSLTILNI